MPPESEPSEAPHSSVPTGENTPRQNVAAQARKVLHELLSGSPDEEVRRAYAFSKGKPEKPK